MSGTPPSEATLLTYSVATLPSPIQVATPLSLTITADNQSGAVIDCTQIVVTVPVGTNAGDLIATAQIEAVPPAGWSAAQSGGQIIFTPPGGSIEVKGQALVFLLAITVNGEPGAANVLIDETASNAANPLAPRSLTWVATKFPVDFTLSDLTAAATDIPYGGPAQLYWSATGAGVTCTLTYVLDDSGTQITATVPAAAPSGGFTTQPLTRAAGVTFYLTAQVSVPGQDEPITLQSQLPVSIETLSLNATVQPLTIPPGGISMITWSAPNATQVITKDGEILPASGTAYVVLQQSHDFSMTAYGAGGQTRQAPAYVTVDPTILATEPGYTITGTAGAQGPVGTAIGFDFSGGESGTVTVNGTVIPVQIVSSSLVDITVDGVTRPLTAADIEALLVATSPSAGRGEDGVLKTALPPLDVTGTSGRVIPINVTGGTGGQGGAGATYTIPIPNYPLSFQAPGCPGGNGGNAYAEITADQTQTPAQYIFTFAAGAGGPGGAGGRNGGWPGANGAPGLTTALAFNGIVVPLDGSLVPPVPFAPLTLRVEANPATVPMNGLAVVRWDSPNADHCVLPDGSVVPRKGRRYMVMTETTDFQVSAFDDFGQTIQASATITVDATIKATESDTETGTAGGAGGVGTSPTWTFNITPPITIPSGWTVGGPGGNGGHATLALTIPPLDATGTSTRVIQVAVTGGAGGAGGIGGCLIVVDAPPPFPSPQAAPVEATASPGGAGGNGGDATLTLTTDPTQAPARVILQVAAGAVGAGGQNGWLYDNSGNNLGASYASPGAAGTASVTIDGQAVELPPASSEG